MPVSDLASGSVSSGSTKSKSKSGKTGKVKAVVAHETLEDITNEPENSVVDSPSLNFFRPLHMATLSNSLETMQVLLDFDADVRVLSSLFIYCMERDRSCINH